jgi:uncharacterized protein YecT (DUF1311 family)
MLIVEGNDSSWRVVTKITITEPPIRVLTSTSHGWRDIGVWVHGGGLEPGYEVQLHFDGKTYPTNPSVPPAQPLAGKVAGKVIISESQEGTLLYSDGSGNQIKEASAGSQPPRPSFNCASAKTPTENLVCRDPDLASIDSAMAVAYRSALQQLPPDQTTAFRRKQLEWFKEYARACDSVASDVERKECVVRYLGSRMEQLKAPKR